MCIAAVLCTVATVATLAQTQQEAIAGRPFCTLNPSACNTNSQRTPSVQTPYPPIDAYVPLSHALPQTHLMQRPCNGTHSNCQPAHSTMDTRMDATTLMGPSSFQGLGSFPGNINRVPLLPQCSAIKSFSFSLSLTGGTWLPGCHTCSWGHLQTQCWPMAKTTPSCDDHRVMIGQHKN